MIPWGICLFLSVLFHLVWSSLQSEPRGREEERRAGHSSSRSGDERNSQLGGLHSQRQGGVVPLGRWNVCGAWRQSGETGPAYMLLFSRWVVSDSLQPHRLQHARLSCPSLSPSLLKLMFIESVMPSNHLILCHPLLLLPSVFPSIRVSSIESVLRIRWPEYWSFSFSISPSHEYSGLVSFRMYWSDLLAVQGTLKSLSLHHGSKASILQHPPERVPVPWWPGKNGKQQRLVSFSKKGRKLSFK